MTHSHSHGHSHGFEGGWAVWIHHSALRVVLAAVVVAALATLVGLAALWPSGSGAEAAAERSAELGIASDRISATVDESSQAECSYSTPERVQRCMVLVLTIHEGPDAGAVIALPEINRTLQPSVPLLEPGDDVVLSYAPSTNSYAYADRERGNVLLWLALAFVVVVVLLGRIKGVFALLAMAVTVVVLVGFVAPSVLDGNDPILVAVVAASAIAFFSLYLTHGFSPTTTVALAGTLGALTLTLVLSALFFNLARFTGLASSESLILPFLAADLDVRGLLLGGAVIGSLGALDDVTVTQVATVSELQHRSPHLSKAELITSGIRVGREHIASTVNTLLLAYAGASMPILLGFAISNQSLGEVANSELVAVEIVRTLCGSIGLVAAVPITTALAAVAVAGASHPGTGATTAPSPPTDVPETPSWDDFGPRDIDRE
jgi:uncharacterized membrane protein